MSKTSIRACLCTHSGQDALHGPGRRVHNALTPKEKTPQEWRCTVCGRVTSHTSRVPLSQPAPKT